MAFSFQESPPSAPTKAHHEMTNTNDISSEDLRRIPGLFRRWELPEVLAAYRCYRIEDAGAHADGTPLLALYAIALAADHTAASPRETISKLSE